MNNKGFMMAELVVVSTIVLVALAGLYSSFNKILSAYKTRFHYYNTTALYQLGYYRDILYENNILDSVKEKSTKSTVVLVYDSNVNGISSNFFSLPTIEIPSGNQDLVYFVYNHKDKITRDTFSSYSVHETFLLYLDFLENSIDYTQFDYVMYMERCPLTDDGTTDENNCDYAYLEILNNE